MMQSIFENHEATVLFFVLVVMLAVCCAVITVQFFDLVRIMRHG